MKKTYKIGFIVFILFAFCLSLAGTSLAKSAKEIEQEARAALQKLYSTSPAALELSKKAKGILVFPKIVKAGLIVGGQYGEGALFVDNKVKGFYNSVSGTFGLQAGAQTFGYALFFMTDDALKYLEKSSGWEIGVGPSVVVVDKGTAKTLTTTTGKADIYAFIFGQKGLMAGLGLQGSKISKINPEQETKKAKEPEAGNSGNSKTQTKKK